jgi:hypothetical protein
MEFTCGLRAVQLTAAQGSVFRTLTMLLTLVAHELLKPKADKISQGQNFGISHPTRNTVNYVSAQYPLGYRAPCQDCKARDSTVVPLRMTKALPVWRRGSYTSTVALRVVGGDEKGSIESETVKYSHKSHGTRIRK